MKKTFIAVAAVVSLATGFAFAQDASIKIGSWINTLASPIASDGDRNYAGMQSSWAGIRETRIGVTGTAADKLAGFKADYYINNRGVDLGLNGYVWVQPIDQIKISAGKFDTPEMGFRGDLTYGSWNWIRPSFIETKRWDEGLTFSGNGSGFAVHLFPIEGLTVYGLLPVDNLMGVGDDNDRAKDWDYGRAYQLWGDGEIAVKYAIDGVGTIKIGYFGKYDKTTIGGDDYERYGDIDVAFDLTAVEDLFVTAGFQYKLGDTEYINTGDWYSASLMKIALGARYKITEDFTVSASGQVFLYDDVYDPRFRIGAGISYYVMDGVELVADVRYISETTGDGIPDQGDDGISFLVGVDKNVGSNGLIGVGFQGVTNGQGFSGGLQYEDKFAWAIPIRIQVGL